MEPTIQILHLEDDPADAELVQARLSESDFSFRITPAATRDEFETALGRGEIDIILADYKLPMYDGMSALQHANELAPDIPFIFVSGTMGEEAAIDALTRGATDYVLKHNLSRLAPAVQRALQEARSRREHRQAEQQIELLSYALDNVHEGAFLIDRQGTITYANQEACRALGYERRELLGMTVSDIDPDTTMEDINKIRAGGQLNAVTFETRHRARSGHIFPVEVTATRIEFCGTEYSLSLVRDISERKKIENERRLAEKVIRQNLAQQKALLYMYQSLNTAPIQDIISFVVGQCVSLTGSAIGFVGLISDDDLQMETHVWSKEVMEDCPLNKPLDFSINEGGLWAEAIRQHRLIIINDYQAPNTQKKGYPEGHLKLSRFMGIPVIDKGRVVAVAGVANRRDVYSESDHHKVSLLLEGMWELIKRQRTEQRLHLLNFALNNVREAIFLIDENARLCFVNEEACRSLGYTREELLSLAVSDVDPDWLLARRPDHWHVLKARGAVNLESRYKTKDGRVFPVEISANYFEYDGKGYSLALARDITARNEAQKRLKESEQRYRSLVENLPEFIMRFGTDLRQEYVNPALTRAYEMPMEEFIGKKLSELPPLEPPGTVEFLEGKIREAIDTGKSNRLESEWSTPDGERCFDITHLPEKDEQGNVVSVLGITRDITERKRAEQERVSHLAFLSNMDRINRAIQGATDLEQMMGDVLSTVLSIFDCDRAYLMYPCDPDEDAFSVEMERCNPDYSDAFTQGLKIPITPDQAETIRILLDADGPVKSGPGCPYDVPREVSERFNIKAFLSMALYPKIGKPWRLGLHQCSYSRDWTPDEVTLFKEIGRRLEDGLTSFLAHRDLVASEERFRMLFENSPVSIWEEDFTAVKEIFADLRQQGVSDIEAWFERHPETVQHCAESARIIDVNRATLDLHGAATKEQLMAGLIQTFTPESFETFRKELVCLWKGRTEMVENTVVKTLSGGSRYVTVYFSICPGYEQTLSKVLVSIIDITDRRRAEESRIATEQRMARCLDNMPGFAYTFRGMQNGHFNFPYASPGIEGLYGLKPEDVKEDMSPIHLLAHPDDQPLIEAAIAESARTMTLFQKEFRVCRLNAPERWIEATSMPTRDADGSILWHGVMLDITDRKRAEDELRNSERHFRTLLDNIPVCITRFNENCHIVYMNRAVEKVFGAPVKKFVGKRVTESAPPTSDAINKKLESMIRRVFAEGVTNRTEEIWNTADGARVFDILHVPEIDEDGKLTDVLGIANDITDRKRAEAEVERLKNYLANIIDSMPLVLAGIDPGGIITQWNRQAMEMTGVSPPDAVGRTVVDLLPDFSPWIVQLQRSVKRHQPAAMEKLLVEKEGDRRFYDLLLYPLVADGVEGAVLCIEDVTEQARIQELMVQTEKMMSLGGLAAGMAHEINNPLGIIAQAAQNIERRLLADLPPNREAADEIGISIDGMKAYYEKRQIPAFVGSIREASGRASRIIANILRFSRGSETTLRPGSLADVLDHALDLAASDFDLKKKYDFRSIEIVRDDAPGMPEVPMVLVEMEQVVLNLLKNATQAMVENPPDRKPRIILHLRREQRYAVIEVADNGPGMTEETRRRVFEPFFTTKEPGIGTGLGLSVSYMIVTQNHKGLMEVASTPGEGACFTVRLPLSREDMT